MKVAKRRKSAKKKKAEYQARHAWWAFVGNAA